ncbi:MAG: TetR family transcriptional regulator [Cellvibrionaceae bacterium]|nr:TetR family transcriptional regulator [Cellvibrionaceae bacterium]|tara:strand:- start:25390 stop:26106 length:717 start_codon:yes stop_codon:yes gene_type:complete
MQPLFDDILQYRGRPALRSDSRARRQAILEAALRVIERDGVRGVKHRAVAAEAQVPLAATTYYFDDIQALLHDAFVHYVETRSSNDSSQLQQKGYELLQDLSGAQSRNDGAFSARLIDGIAGILFEHVKSQVEQAAERRVEVAFRHEALCNKDLAEVVSIPHQLQLRAIESFLVQLASPNPKADAQVVMGTLLYLEYNLSLSANSEQWQRAQQTLQRMIAGLLLLSSKAEASGQVLNE